MKDLVTKLKIFLLNLFSLILRIIKSSIGIALSQIKD